MYYHSGIGITSSINRPNFIIVDGKVTNTTGWSYSDLQQGVQAFNEISLFLEVRKRANCSHPSVSNFISTSQSDVDAFRCNMANKNSHRAFENVGYNAKLCNNCHSFLCKACSTNNKKKKIFFFYTLNVLEAI